MSLAVAEEVIRDQQEAAKRLDEFRKTGPREHLAHALERAGLPNDLRKIAGGWLIVRTPAGSMDNCFLVQVISVQLLYYQDLRIDVSPFSPFASRFPDATSTILEFQDGKWAIPWIIYDKIDRFPINLIELLD